MSKSNDGGPAFPHLGLYAGADGNLHPTATQFGGMSLRDWFASRAPQPPEGWLMGRISLAQTDQQRLAAVAEASAEWSYQFADAMLAAREASEPEQ